MFYAIIRINLVVDIKRFEDLVVSKTINHCTGIAFVDSLQQIKEAAVKLIPVASSTFIACATENKKSPLCISKYTDVNNLIRDMAFEWTDCEDVLILPVKSTSKKEKIYTKTHQTLNAATSLFYGKSSKDHSSGSIAILSLTECLETDKLFCSGDILYQDLIYYHQPRIFDCADASMKMLIDYHIQKCDELKYDICLQPRKELKFNYDNRPIKLFSGKNSADLKSYSDFLNDINLKKSIKKASIKEVLPGHLTYYLYNFGPLIVRTDEIGGHFMVVKGIIGNRVLIDDPWAGSNILVKFDEFNKKWDGTIVYFSAGYSKYIEKLNQQKNNLT
ncbi:cysteine peptidase family C39 domain-containing protein [Legionella sp. CNM-1927-20]|uniref:cysteine peptidase family C39 domain-containing protein n=1 Tax=Legionella sp. CNM-1927-20 TaxID=3422221 RepID=UPI00403A7EE1